MIRNKPRPNIGIAIKNTMARSLLIVKVKIKAVSNMTGERTKGRIPLEMAVCKMVTSLVKRVIKELVEKWSVFAKENSCTFLNSSFRNSAPNPCPAVAANRAYSTPKTSASNAHAIILEPCNKIYVLS